MSAKLTITADWEKQESGEIEDRATFAAIGILHGNIWLTEAEDVFVKRIRQKVHLSGYRLAEWLAWNWWRLRWEPRRSSDDWSLAHKMTSIGRGYVWPNVTIVSDGERVALICHSTAPNVKEPLRYINDYAAIIPSSEFESAVEAFINQVTGQLVAEGIKCSNLDTIWREVNEERSDPQISQFRKFEALFGYDPDEAPLELLKSLVEQSASFGESAVQELAADRLNTSISSIREIASTHGLASNPRDAVRLADKSTAALPSNVAAWQRGAEAARALREQEKLGAAPISNDRLAQLNGMPSVLNTEYSGVFSFALDENATTSRIVVRSRHKTGRRFEIARLLGDRVASASKTPLIPATKAYTYRQKLQRSFAAEFLCPFEAVADMLNGDFSDEAIEEAAAYFDVSELTVRTLLVNHKQINRDDLYAIA